MPPPLINAPGGSTGPAAPPTANLGAETDGDSKMREAVHLMEMALPRFQMGSDKHKAVIDCLNKITKVWPPGGEQSGIQNTQLIQLAQRAKQNAMIQAAMRQHAAMQQQGGGGGMPPGGGGAEPPPGAPPGLGA